MANTMSRTYGEGSVYQRCEARFGCPPLEDGPLDQAGKPTRVRPEHKCKGRWFGVVEAGVTASGVRRRITVSAKTQSVAQRKHRDKKAEIAKAGHHNTRRTTTVARWTQEWLEHIETRVRPSSLTTDKAASKWIMKTIGSRNLSELTPRDVRAVAAAIRSGGGSSSTALRYHGSLMRILKAARQEGYTIPDNVLSADRPTAAVNDRQAIPLLEAIAILRHLTRRDETGALVMPDSSRWSLAFLQGLRQGESLGLTWDEVDLEAETLTVSWQAQTLKYREKGNARAGFVIPDGYEVRHLAGATHLVRPKSSAGHRVMPLVPWASAALRDWRAVAPPNVHGLVWPGRSTSEGDWPKNSASDRRQWERIQKAAGVSHPAGRLYTPHEIRHTTATLLMELKVPESVRIKIMGHSTIASTRSYEFADVRQAREALAEVGRMLELD